MELRRYRRIAGWTIGAVIFLVLVGGIVRSTGSGLGCPDWPKCFGKWVPPTDVSQLPSDYKTRFEIAGKEIADFDPFKTWVEYLNRLVGVLIGFFAILTAWFSLPLRHTQKRVTQLSVLTLLMVIVQGGIGAKVVSSHLETWMVTIHMVIAMVIVMMLITAYLLSHRSQIESWATALSSLKPQVWWLGIGVAAVTLIQIVLGTQVREEVDIVAEALGEESRSVWTESLGTVYLIHRTFYYLVVVGILGWMFQLKGAIAAVPMIKKLAVAMLGCVLLEIIFGLCMHHFGILPVLQPLHLLFATVLFAIEYSLLGALWIARKK